MKETRQEVCGSITRPLLFRYLYLRDFEFELPSEQFNDVYQSCVVG